MPKKINNSQFTTKSDLKNLERRMDGRFERVDEKLDKLQNTLDGFVGVVDNLRIENEVGANQISELRKQTDDHETRIASLETSRGQ